MRRTYIIHRVLDYDFVIEWLVKKSGLDGVGEFCRSSLTPPGTPSFFQVEKVWEEKEAVHTQKCVFPIGEVEFLIVRELCAFSDGKVFWHEDNIYIEQQIECEEETFQ